MSSWLFLAVFLFGLATFGDCGSCREAKLCCSGRDSSCVVQKAPINAIIEDLSDKPCYCDHACLRLGDCCPDFKEACGVVDCQVTPWGPWSPCDADCGPGTMSRSRSIKTQPQNGGRHCPSLEQRRGCQVSNCHHHPDPAIKEIAMLLPGSLSHSRTANHTSDIRKNLGVRDPSENPQYDPKKTYCVEFEVLKASKACRKEDNYKTLKEGEHVCVRCESEALHENLGWRCQGHGVEGRPTRWSALSAPHCHGKWARVHHVSDAQCRCPHEQVIPRLRVLNGKPVDYRNYSFYVNLAIQHINKTSNECYKEDSCSGTIIGKKWILTAAHCFSGKNTDLDVIISGYNNFKNYTRDAYVKIHQNYTLCDDNVTINDIALIRLENDIDIEKYNIYINQLQIMKGDTDVDGKEAVIIGINSTTYKLEEAHLQVIDTTTCQQLCNTTTQLSSEFHICGFSNTTNASTCQGDSGGPLLLLDKNPIGVSAFTCAHNTAKSKRFKPSVFTRVSHYYEWICDMIDEKDEINEVCPDRSFPWYINFITFFGVIINVISPVNSNSAIIAVIAIIVIGIGLIGLILVWKCWTQRDSNSDKDEYEFRPLTTTGECQTK